MTYRGDEFANRIRKIAVFVVIYQNIHFTVFACVKSLMKIGFHRYNG